jgi:hypothetical protein
MLASRHSRNHIRCLCSGIDKIAEDKIARWLKEGGASDLPHHRGPLASDPHLHAARITNLYDEYVHSKILADNRILPKSIELRKRLDKGWEDLRLEIQRRWTSAGRPEIAAFLEREDLCQSLRGRMHELDLLAKAVNGAVIEDSMRFGGRSPVRHARRFVFEDRVAEALQGMQGPDHRKAPEGT